VFQGISLDLEELKAMVGAEYIFPFPGYAHGWIRKFSSGGKGNLNK